MTGFAKAEGKIKGGILTIEIKSFNHRFFEVITRLPPELLNYEEEIKQRLKRKIRRGSLNVVFNYFFQKTHLKRINLDEKIIKMYLKMGKKISQDLGIEGNFTLRDLLNLPGVLNYEEKNIDLSKEWGKCKKILDKAIEELMRKKYREGEALLKDIFKNISLMEMSLKKIENRREKIVKEFKEKFKNRFKEITEEIVSRDRLLEEVSLFLRNSDISEEIVRIKNHLKEMCNLLRKEKEVGRRLDFIAQEIFREANTLSAKANDYLTSCEAITMKSCVEKIREQGQNLE